MSNIQLTLTPKLSADLPITEDNISENPRFAKLFSMSQSDMDEIAEFLPQIDLTDITLINTYGETCQRQNTSFSESTLKRLVKNYNTSLTDIFNQIAQIIGDFSDSKKKLNVLVENFLIARNLVNQLKNELECIELTLSSFNDELVSSQNKLEKIYKTLSKYILAGEMKLEQVNNAPSPKFDALGSTEHYLNSFKKRLDSLRLSRTVTLQMLSQVYLLITANSAKLESIKGFCLNTIPEWENSMIIALGISGISISSKPILNQYELKKLAKKMLKSSNGLNLDDFYSSNNIIYNAIK